MAEFFLSTQHLWLRPPSLDDLPFILERMNTVAVMRHLGGEVRSEEEASLGLRDDIDAFARGTYRRWTVWRREDECRIGRCGLFHVRTEAAPATLRGQPEIGWTQAEEFWGHGYATEAAGAVLDFAFATLGLPLLYAQTSDSNVRSTRMMERLGFSPRPELGYNDPDYPPADNPTTVWFLTSEDWFKHG
jgi:RimJ/RimL family protein N-acetyltransferase